MCSDTDPKWPGTTRGATVLVPWASYQDTTSSSLEAKWQLMRGAGCLALVSAGGLVLRVIGAGDRKTKEAKSLQSCVWCWIIKSWIMNMIIPYHSGTVGLSHKLSKKLETQGVWDYLWSADCWFDRGHLLHSGWLLLFLLLVLFLSL